ncbi:hypothetical protein DAI22_12g134800 [Oryza sativa Japonica Group]|jgi:hypothetical protein|nr:hypothetical protein DAI22_12g134800 [Oryza sativa Japonica Group]
MSAWKTPVKDVSRRYSGGPCWHSFFESTQFLVSAFSPLYSYGQRKNDAESRTRKCHSILGIERYNFHTVSDDVEFLRIDEGIASARI